MRAGIRFATCWPSSSGSTALRTGTGGWTPPVDLLETPDRVRGDGGAAWTHPRRRRRSSTHDGRLTSRAYAASATSAVRTVPPRRTRPRRFSRTFQLPMPVDAERITADLRDGVLTVTCPKASDASAPPHSDQLIAMTHADASRSSCSCSSSFAAGLLLADRQMRELRPKPRAQAPAPRGPAVDARPGRPRRPAGTLTDFSRIAERDHPGGRQHLVAAGRPAAESPFATRSSAVLRRRRRHLRLAARRREQPRLRRHRQQRRLHPHKQPRRHRRSTPSDDRATRRDGRARATSARCAPRSSASIRRPTSPLLKIDAQNLPTMPWGDSSKLKVAEWVLGDRQPVSAEPDRHARHRVGRRAGRTSASRRTRISFRPTPRSIPATPAARWSTRAASWSASTR